MISGENRRDEKQQTNIASPQVQVEGRAEMLHTVIAIAIFLYCTLTTLLPSALPLAFPGLPTFRFFRTVFGTERGRLLMRGRFRGGSSLGFGRVARFLGMLPSLPRTPPALDLSSGVDDLELPFFA